MERPRRTGVPSSAVTSAVTTSAPGATSSDSRYCTAPEVTSNRWTLR